MDYKQAERNRKKKGARRGAKQRPCSVSFCLLVLQTGGGLAVRWFGDEGVGRRLDGLVVDVDGLGELDELVHGLLGEHLVDGQPVHVVVVQTELGVVVVVEVGAQGQSVLDAEGQELGSGGEPLDDVVDALLVESLKVVVSTVAEAVAADDGRTGEADDVAVQLGVGRGGLLGFIGGDPGGEQLEAVAELARVQAVEPECKACQGQTVVLVELLEQALVGLQVTLLALGLSGFCALGGVVLCSLVENDSEADGDSQDDCHGDRDDLGRSRAF